MDTKRGKWGQWDEWEIGIDVYTPQCIKQVTDEDCCIAQRTLLSALW